MKIKASKHILAGRIRVPGSKSHTIRALLLSSLAEGVSRIENPLPSADCLSAGHAVPLIGAAVDFGGHEEGKNDVWTVTGAGKKAHLPDNVVDVGNSGSLLYFMAPIAATFPGWSIFTGDESIRKRPVSHVTDALKQMGAETHIARPDIDAPPFIIKGPVSTENTVITDGRLSQYISGIMMAAVRLTGTVRIELTDPKEVPYLTMTKLWLESLGVPVSVSGDFKHISVTGPCRLKGFDRTVPSDWEAAAFPLIAALLTDSELVIENIDGSGTQGDEAVVGILQSVGADVEWDKMTAEICVRGGSRARPFSLRKKNTFLSEETIRACGIPGRLSTKGLPGGELHVTISDFPDAVCALSVIACFIDGRVVLEDIGVCRRKETDRIAVLKEQLGKLGADIEEGADYFAVNGHSQFAADGTDNPEYRLHGGTVESFRDHRTAMAFACMGLALDDTVTVKDAESCSVSFPRFFDVMNSIGAGFQEDC